MIWQGGWVDGADFTNKVDKFEANDANKVKAYEVNKAIVANPTNKANVIKEIIVTNKAIVTADKTIVIEKIIAVDKAIVIDEVILINKAIVADEAKANKAIWFCCCCLYSLTKYSAIFAEVKGYFGIFEHNNQLVGMVCRSSLIFVQNMFGEWLKHFVLPQKLTQQ